MADSCISYAEASKLHPTVNKSFVDILKTKTVTKSSPNNQVPSNNLSTTSYKETIFLKPRSPKNTHYSTQYDHATHKQMIKDYDMPSSSGNGCALKTPDNDNNNDNVNIFNIITNLINSFSKSNLINPDHAAIMIEAINNTTVHNGSQTPKYTTVELS
jgi:hypothetical protein